MTFTNDAAEIRTNRIHGGRVVLADSGGLTRQFANGREAKAEAKALAARGVAASAIRSDVSGAWMVEID